MKYIVFDMEWNQTYGKERRLSYGRSLSGEIIEIGAVRLGEDFSYEDVFKIYVRPVFYKKMHSMVKRLTGIDGETLKNGVTFREAYDEFKKFCTDDFATLTWGDSDIPVLRENAEAHGLERWSAKNYNLQRIYMKQFGLKNCIALESAAESLGISPEDVKYHDAAFDAAVTAEVARKIDTARGIAEYTMPPGDFSDLEILGFRKVEGVANLQKLRADPRIRFTLCPVCSTPLEAKRIIPQGSGKKISCIECAEHGKFLLRLRTSRERPAEEGKEMTFSVSKYIYGWNEEVGKLWDEKLEAADRKKEKFLSRVRGRRSKKKREKSDNVDVNEEKE